MTTEPRQEAEQVVGEFVVAEVEQATEPSVVETEWGEYTIEVDRFAWEELHRAFEALSALREDTDGRA